MRKAMPAEFPGPPGCIQGGETSREVNQKGLFDAPIEAEENGMRFFDSIYFHEFLKYGLHPYQRPGWKTSILNVILTSAK